MEHDVTGSPHHVATRSSAKVGGVRRVFTAEQPTVRVSDLSPEELDRLRAAGFRCSEVEASDLDALLAVPGIGKSTASVLLEAGITAGNLTTATDEEIEVLDLNGKQRAAVEAARRSTAADTKE